MLPRMAQTMVPVDVVHQYFQAMQAGAAGADQLFALFADDAVYVEPFSGIATGTSNIHEGLDAIKAQLRRELGELTPPELELTVNRVDVDGDVVRSEWTCSSPAFDAPVRGIDVCIVRDGRIQRLEVRLA